MVIPSKIVSNRLTITNQSHSLLPEQMNVPRRVFPKISANHRVFLSAGSQRVVKPKKCDRKTGKTGQVGSNFKTPKGMVIEQGGERVREMQTLFVKCKTQVLL